MERPDFVQLIEEEEVLVPGFPTWDTRPDQKHTIDSVADYGRRMFELGLSAAGGRWIPVSEQLPEKEARVLCAINSSDCCLIAVCTRFHHHGQMWWSQESSELGDTRSCFRGDEVRHWMPLPAFPEEL